VNNPCGLYFAATQNKTVKVRLHCNFTEIHYCPIGGGSRS